jgi:hypothetical protein
MFGSLLAAFPASPMTGLARCVIESPEHRLDVKTLAAISAFPARLPAAKGHAQKESREHRPYRHEDVPYQFVEPVHLRTPSGDAQFGMTSLPKKAKPQHKTDSGQLHCVSVPVGHHHLAGALPHSLG